jgi:hypothetical protein
MQQDFINQEIVISSDVGIIMSSVNGVIKSFPLDKEPGWIAINIAGENIFFEDLTEPEIVKDDLAKLN